MRADKENLRILCLDDEKDIVQAYIDILMPQEQTTPKKSSRIQATKSGSSDADRFEVLHAYDGNAAIEIVKKSLAEGRPIAGGFFDVKLEGSIDGIQTIQAIWKLDPRVHCTIVTAYQDRSVQDINQVFGEQFKDQWDFLNKPFTHGEITQKARQMTAAWNRKQALLATLDELKATQDHLLRSERLAAIGQVARGVGHEFGNILQRIVGKADLALAQSDVEKMREALKVILTAAERSSVIVRNLQSISKTSNLLGSVELEKIVDETLALINHELMKASIQVHLNKSNVEIFQGNAVEVQQVLMNLIINAMHAMPKGGELTVACGQDASHVYCTVKDTGTGISPEVLPRIFEYAFTTKGDQGSGLGLSISKKIVESHGGVIEVATEVGKGTQFTFKIPRQKSKKGTST